jgi:hypothetical protein
MSYSEIIINGSPVKLIPLGECACGCGGKTALASYTRKGAIKGTPNKYIHGHHTKGINNWHWNNGKIQESRYPRLMNPNHSRSINGYVYEHILIAERALGKPLPPGVVVHHANGVSNDNSRGNHVICQDEKYHRFIEKRLRAFLACGNKSWRKCSFCGKYDDPQNMYVRKHNAWHRQCVNEYNRRGCNERRSIRSRP